MRLTLRTLLAYLDNTLDAQDAEALRTKLAESSFATQLVQRIRGSLANANLAAPSPDAVGPIEDANAISEYLDSTLSTEQIAEIERACLESDPHLAEAAACHQILTMVLGKPANVPPELRKRIYELPDRQIDQIASGVSYASLSVPVEPIIVDPDLEHLAANATPGGVEAQGANAAGWSDDVPTADATVAPHPSAVKPVGVGDSGVSDAPTRLREIENLDDARATAPIIGSADPAIAGSRPRSIADTDIYGGSIRPSRITPWLVTLGVAAALLLALSQIFAPFLSRNHTDGDPDSVAALELEPVRDGDPAGKPPATSPSSSDPSALSAGETKVEPPADLNGVGTPAETTTDAPSPVATESAASDSPPSATEPAAAAPPVSASVPLPTVEESDSEPAETASIDDRSSPPEPMEPSAPEPRPPAVTVRAESENNDDVPPPASEVMDAESESPNPAIPADMPLPPAPTEIAPTEIAPTEIAPTAVAPTAVAPAQPIGKVVSDQSLLSILENEDWTELRQGAPVHSEAPLVCAPTFRGTVVADDARTISLIGPTTVHWKSDPSVPAVMSVRSGRVLISPGEDPLAVDVVIAGQPLQITFSNPSHVVAIEVTHWREPGRDPLAAENHIPIRSIHVLQDAVTVSGIGEQTIEPGQVWRMYGNEPPTLSESDAPPDWTQPPSDSDMTLEANARNGLMELLAEGGSSLETALREATSFRKSEVAALAAQSLLALGRGDVYFDGVGILNQPKQRAYWPDHFASLQARLAQDVESAAGLHESIARTDSANGETIVRLLTGYSQQQLIDGGDQELVELLDSPSMAVRVLALENLRNIIGTTLYYRAEQENAVRREPYIKKWIARQRKGDIRWPE